MKTLLAALLLLPFPLVAQDYHDTTRDEFTFLNTRIVIEVATEAPGMLRVMRGGSGSIKVTARATNGFAGYDLTPERERLMLTSVGADRVDYLVIVPADTHIELRLPSNQTAQTVGTMQKLATYRWGPPPAPPAPGQPQAATPASKPVPEGDLVAYASSAAPHMLRLRGARIAAVRMEGSRFVVASAKSLDSSAAGTGVVDITADSPSDVSIRLPADTRDFILQLEGQTALIVRGPNFRTYCTPASKGTDTALKWATFGPDATRLSCRTP